KVQGEFKWCGSALVSFIPSSPLVMGMPYTLGVRLDSVVDFTGHIPGDSLWVRKFRTLDTKSVGSIKGKVADDSARGGGRVRVAATSISAKGVRPVREAIDAPGDFFLDRLVEGKYVIEGFRDADGNGVYTYGTPFPYHPSERFSVYPDTLKVRARWPLEGV